MNIIHYLYNSRQYIHRKTGDTVIVYNRKFLVYNVDDFTKAFYWKHFGLTDFTAHNVEQIQNKLAKMVSLYKTIMFKYLKWIIERIYSINEILRVFVEI